MALSDFSGSSFAQFGQRQQDRNCVEGLEAELDGVGGGETSDERHRKNCRKFPSQSGSITFE